MDDRIRSFLKKFLASMLDAMPSTQESGKELFVRPIEVLAYSHPDMKLSEAAQHLRAVSNEVLAQRS